MYKKPFKKFISLFVTAAMIFTFAATFNTNEAKAADNSNLTTIDILSVNDFHGALTDTVKKDSNGAVYAKQSGALTAGKINSLKAKNPDGTIVVSAGDMFQGTPESNILFGKPVVDIMNYLGFETMTLGNHEFDWGVGKLKEIEKDTKATILAANIYDKNTSKRVDFAQPYKILEKKGIKVGIIGVTTPETPNITLPAYTKDLVFKDPAEEVNSLINEVKEKGADVIVVVGHIGAKQDSATGVITGEAADMAAKLDSSKVSAIISGHSHETVAGTVNGIAVVQGYYNGRAIEHISLAIDPATKKVVSAVATAEDCYKKYTEITPDANVQKIVDDAKAQVGTVFDEVVGKTSVDLALNFNAESNAGNFVTDVMRQAVKVDAAFEVPGDLRSDIVKGNITVGDLYKLLPWDNTIYTMKLTGAQLKEVLEQGATLDKGMIQVSGLKFKYDPGKAKGQKVYDIILSNGDKVQMDKEYTVAANDYVATGGDNFSTFLKGRDIVNTYIMERDAVSDYIKELNKNGQSVNTAVEGRIVAAKESSTTAPVQLNAYKTVKITTQKGLRIRAAANTSSKILGAIKYGTSVNVYEDLGQWYKVKHNGVDAYIYKAYTK